MANHDVNVCDDWTGSADDSVTFTNNKATTCNIQSGSTVWPFTSGPPITIAAGGNASTSLKTSLTRGNYSYTVDCCGAGPLNQKGVTVP
jgi:hypothetical protein